jgi:hypothetical protein
MERRLSGRRQGQGEDDMHDSDQQTARLIEKKAKQPVDAYLML